MPFFEQLAEDLFAIRREPVETLVALLFFAPLAREQSLRFEPAKQWIERALVDGQTALGKLFAQRVAVVFFAKLRQHGQSQAAAPQLQAKILEKVLSECHAVLHTLYINYCM